jgi:hypothetical protein
MIITAHRIQTLTVERGKGRVLVLPGLRLMGYGEIFQQNLQRSMTSVSLTLFLVPRQKL